MSLRVLFVASEMAPFVKVGGLADVIEGLPAALKALGHDVRVLLPLYADIRAPERTAVKSYQAPVACAGTRLFETRAPGSHVPVWLLDAPGFGDRPGNPYVDTEGRPYPDNAARFNRLCAVAAAVAENTCGLNWQPDVVHGHDWHAGLAPVWMRLRHAPAASVFTIHNLGYQGLFPRDTFTALHLPESLWDYRALEFYGQFSFMKGGLVFSDRLTTVSPNYAREILTEAYGCGLQGVLAERSGDLSGILNGIDTAQWNPEADALIARHYSHRDLRPKHTLKRALLKELGLPARAGVPLLAFVGRLVGQKGIDILLAALPNLMKLSLQIIVLGSGERGFEQALGKAVSLYPKQLAARLVYDEALAHRIYAGADMLFMPSRFEPCGLSQLYALRYGTVPIVHATGGLVDTVTDASAANIAAGTATGLCFSPLDAATIRRAVQRAVRIYKQKKTIWRAMMGTGMQRDDSWTASAQQYVKVYKDALRRGVEKP